MVVVVILLWVIIALLCYYKLKHKQHFLSFKGVETKLTNIRVATKTKGFVSALLDAINVFEPSPTWWNGLMCVSGIKVLRRKPPQSSWNSLRPSISVTTTAASWACAPSRQRTIRRNPARSKAPEALCCTASWAPAPAPSCCAGGSPAPWRPGRPPLVQRCPERLQGPRKRTTRPKLTPREPLRWRWRVRKAWRHYKQTFLRVQWILFTDGSPKRNNSSNLFDQWYRVSIFDIDMILDLYLERKRRKVVMYGSTGRWRAGFTLLCKVL